MYPLSLHSRKDRHFVPVEDKNWILDQVQDDRKGR